MAPSVIKTFCRDCTPHRNSERAVHFLDLIMLVCFRGGDGQLFVGRELELLRFEDSVCLPLKTFKKSENLMKIEINENPKSNKVSFKKGSWIQEPMKFQEVLFVIMNQKILEVNQEIQ